MTILFRRTIVLLLSAMSALMMVFPACAKEPAELTDLSSLVARAHPGQVVVLPAGHYRGGVTVPPGVTLKGAGYRLTIVDATGFDSGLTIAAGHDVGIEGLTVSGARVNGIAVTHADNVHLTGVRVTGSMMGVNVTETQRIQLENVVSDHNRFGIVMNRFQHGTVVNCTVADCMETGLLIPTGDGITVFNTVVSNVSTCVNIGSSTNVNLDHNLYMGQYMGTMADQLVRPQLIGWQSLSGQDAHSLQHLVTFRDADGGDYTPTSTLPWALDRLVTSGWGVDTLGGINAPSVDIRGDRRRGKPSLGAFGGDAHAPRPADGHFSVTRGDGITSAGVFTKDGTLLAYLFQNLPLNKGTYPFWLPTRDYAGRPVPTGAYEVRLVESRLKWQYLSHIADNGDDRSAVGRNATASHDPVSAAILPGGSVLMGENESEDHTNLRCYAESDRSVQWTMAGAYHMRGVAMGDDGYAYTLRTLDGQSARLTRLDPVTGKLVSWGAEGNEHACITISDGSGLAVLGGKVYTVAGGKLVTIDLAAVAKNPQTTGIADTLTIATPSCPTADSSTKCIWVISGGSLVVLGADGAAHTIVSPAGDPVSISAAGGQIAIASAATGKINVYDAHDPQHLVLLHSVGSGDGPFGPFSATRFLFQNAPGWTHTETNIALGSNGELAVVDWGRLILLDKLGVPLWYTYGVFGNQVHPSYSTGNRRLWATEGNRSYRLDERTGEWAPDAYWDVSAIPGLDREWSVVFRGDFTDHGKTFGVYCGHNTSLSVVRFDDYRAVPVLMIAPDPAHPKQLIARKDVNHDGRIDDSDPGEVVMGPDGKPVTSLFDRFEDLQENGDILIYSGAGTVVEWRYGGVDADGVPIYRGQDRTVLARLDNKNFIDPYDGKPGGAQWMDVATRQPSGGYTVQTYVRGSGGTGANNGAGTDLVGLDESGKLRWMNQLAYLHGIAGMGTANGVTITSKFDSGEFLAFDEDGLGLGGFTEVPQLHYIGIWIDHPNLFMYRGLDGHGYVMYGDNVAGRYPWYRMVGDDQCLRQRYSCTVSEQLAATLAGLPAVIAPIDMTPPHPTVMVAHLNAPLTIDGSLEKWRAAGVHPQVLFPPRDGDIKKASAMVRVAYEGQNLYIQVLDFDNIPTFHFGPQCPVWQDCLEMGINGAGIGDATGGFQYLAYRGPGGKTYVSRYRFFNHTAVMMLDPEHTPCSVSVLPNAMQVPERVELENLWGADLSKSKVIVTEFKLPFDSQTYVGSEADCPHLGPGKSFWLGLFVDGSDFPGEELQHPMMWPPTFGFFSPKESGAIAICD